MNPNDEYSLNNPNASLLDDDNEPEFNQDFYRQDNRLIAGEGTSEALLSRSNELYRSMKGDWKRSDFNKSKNILITTGRKDGKFYITREQFNAEAIAERCKRYRAASEQGIPDPLAPIGDDGKLTYKWMDLPDVIAIRISDEYFGGMPWQVIKRDRTLKAQFYKVVETEYNQYVCYPHGKLPIPVDVPYPAKVGQQKFFNGR